MHSQVLQLRKERRDTLRAWDPWVRTPELEGRFLDTPLVDLIDLQVFPYLETVLLGFPV